MNPKGRSNQILYYGGYKSESVRYLSSLQDYQNHKPGASDILVGSQKIIAKSTSPKITPFIFIHEICDIQE